MSEDRHQQAKPAASAARYILGVDTGGTFTDFALLDCATGQLRAHKVLSTPENPAAAILQGLEQLGLDESIAAGTLQIIHGSTVATNAALERKGVKTAFVTNSGLKDMLSIGRQTRKALYQLQAEPQVPPVAESLCFEVDARRDAQGEVVAPLTDANIQQLVQQLDQQQPEAVAINLLFSYLNEDDELRIEQALADRYFVSRSSFVSPEPGEYERGIATWLNAYLGPKVESYLNHLHRQVSPCPLAIMQSNGGTIDAEQAGKRSVNLLLSGPAGGLAGAQFLTRSTGLKRLLTFDMGGTSTDVALIDGDIKLTTESYLADFPISVPMVDMHTIGAGGGSLAYADAGGLLQVGPQSAGANPGPACYGFGGNQATVTDANAVLGRLRPDNPLGGSMSLDNDSAQQVMQPLAQALGLSEEEAAGGIIELVNEHMTRALRVISVNQGYDPKDFALCCFGGAGGLHVCALADNLNMTQAIIPALGGVFSAVGMLSAPKVRQLSTSHPALLEQVDANFLKLEIDSLSGQGREQLCAEGVDISAITCSASLDLRYQGQSFSLNIDFQSVEQALADFHRAHKNLYGHRLELPVELVTLRVRAKAPSTALKTPVTGLSDQLDEQTNLPNYSVLLAQLGPTQVLQRSSLNVDQIVMGPALICEPLATTLVEPNWQATVDKFGNILLTRT